VGEHTGISWTDHTFNPWWGCTKVSPGCDNCYAEAFDKRVGGAHWGKGQPRREFGDKHWNEPLKWNRDALAKLGRPARVFCASMADVMDDEAPAGARERLWALIDATPNLIWQLLTKRPQRYDRYLPDSFKHNNVHLGVTTEDQERYEIRQFTTWYAATGRRLPWWISYEPALGPLNLTVRANKPAWAVFGGESGNNRRPCEREWAELLLEQCRKFNIAFFMKQMGGRTPDEGKALIPADLLIQEFPA
jgi:protein gp37